MKRQSTRLDLRLFARILVLMRKPREKPQGKIGPIRTGPDGVDWMVILFPKEKAEREVLVAGLFVKAFDRWVAGQSEPSLAPFGEPVQNDENDLDFTLETTLGAMRMELAEFAPLTEHGPRFADAPTSLQPREKAALALELVVMKSDHQGGESRFLVIYNTEHGFWLDPMTIERMRRALQDAPPRFERVYYVSIHDLGNGSASEIYPGTPHHIFGEADLDAMNVTIPHPADFRVARTVSWSGIIMHGGRHCPVNYTVEYQDFRPMREVVFTDKLSGPEGESL